MLNTTSKYPSKQCLLRSFAFYFISHSYMLLFWWWWWFFGVLVLGVFFFYFATRSALFSQAGLLEIPNLPAEGKAWDIQDEHCEKSRRVMQT